MTFRSASTTHHRRSLAALTAAKWASNVALRWIPPFLPTLEIAFGASTSTMTTVLGAGELAGLSTALTGRWSDRGHERAVVVGSTLLVGLSCLVALGGSLALFAVSYMLLIVGVANLTVAGHSWIGNRVPFTQRARDIGLFETSWAFALLIGAPLAGLLVTTIGWRSPLVAWAIACGLTAAVVVRVVPRGAPITGPSPTGVAAAGTEAVRLPRRAWPPLLTSGFIAGGGVSIFVVSGAWLHDRFGLSAGGVGAVAIAFGVVELVASGASAVWADRIGKRRSVLIGLSVLVVGGVLMAMAGNRTGVGVVGLTVYLGGFEFGFVSSLSLVSEAAPEARGKAVGIGNALGTIVRATSAVLTGVLYDRWGIRGSLAWAAAALAVAIANLAAIRPTTVPDPEEPPHRPDCPTRLTAGAGDPSPAGPGPGGVERAR